MITVSWFTLAANHILSPRRIPSPHAPCNMYSVWLPFPDLLLLPTIYCLLDVYPLLRHRVICILYDYRFLIYSCCQCNHILSPRRIPSPHAPCNMYSVWLPFLDLLVLPTIYCLLDVYPLLMHRVICSLNVYRLPIYWCCQPYIVS